MPTWIVKVYVMVKEVILVNLCLKWVCLVLGENHVATHVRYVPLSTLPLTNVECMIYHIWLRPFVWLGLYQTFQISSLPLLLSIKSQPVALLQGCGESRKHMFTVTVVVVESCRWFVRAIKAGHGVSETNGGWLAGMGAWGAMQSMKRNPPLNENQSLFWMRAFLLIDLRLWLSSGL